jgi:hypothetical protein
VRSRALALAVVLLSCAALAGAADPKGELRVGIPWTPENLDPTMNLSSIRACIESWLWKLPRRSCSGAGGSCTGVV